MASPQIYSGGAGGVVGAELATLAPLYTSGNIWYVHHTGSDAASPRGKERIRPLATIEQAFTNSATYDTVVCLEGHQQSVSAVITTMKQGQRLIGEGSGASRPRFTRAVNDELFDFAARGIYLDNLYFAAGTVASALPKVKLTQSVGTTWVNNCYFECGGNDTGTGLSVNLSAGTRITNCNFVSSSTSTSSQPGSGLVLTGGTAQDVVLDNVVFDGGASGWSNPYAMDFSAGAAELYATNIDLLNDSDVFLATGTTGHFHVRNTTPGRSARVVWTA